MNAHCANCLAVINFANNITWGMISLNLMKRNILTN